MSETGHVEWIDERLVMTQMAIQKGLTVVACVLMLCALAPTLAVADQAQYIYDDLGRLSQVIDGQGHVAMYTYDAVGNLLLETEYMGGLSFCGRSGEVFEKKLARRCPSLQASVKLLMQSTSSRILGRISKARILS